MVKIGMAQMDIAWEDIKENQKKVITFFDKAKEEKTDCIVFPEMTLTGFSMNVEKTGVLWREQVDFFRKMSLEYDIMTIFGYAMPLSDVLMEEHPDWNPFHNRLGVAERGRMKLSYAKIHPFSYGLEGDYYQGGEELVSMQWKGIRFSPFICYDLRFPEIFQICSKESELLFVIANWPGSRIGQWEILLQARAIENQAIVVGVNRTGEGDGLHYNGHSVIYGPTGECLTEIKEEECLITGEVDLEKVKKSRKGFPMKEDRRENLYRKLWENARRRHGK